MPVLMHFYCSKDVSALHALTILPRCSAQVPHKVQVQSGLLRQTIGLEELSCIQNPYIRLAEGSSRQQCVPMNGRHTLQSKITRLGGSAALGVIGRQA